MRTRQRKYRIEKLIKRDGNICHYCKVPLGHKQATLDHKLPRCQGGSHHVSNLVLACRSCNQEKGDMPYSEFKKMSNKAHNPVSNPLHYTSHPIGFECIQATRHMSFNLGSAFKYVWRDWDSLKDDPKLSLSKALWYIRDHMSSKSQMVMIPTLESEQVANALIARGGSQCQILYAIYRADFSDSVDVASLWLNRAILLVERRMERENQPK